MKESETGLNPLLLLNFLELIKKLIESLPLPLNQRPSHPAINGPASGSTITGSLTQTVPIIVDVSTNRPDEGHVVELLNADTFQLLSTGNVDFTTTPPSATVSIPVLIVGPATTMILQCRAPTDASGNVHSILISVQPPQIPPPPTVTLGATTSTGTVLVSGSTIDHTTTTGLGNVTFTANPTGTGMMTPHWTVVLGSGPVAVASTLSSINQNLIPMGVTYPTLAFVSVFVTDQNGQSSTPAQFSCTIT